jgi:hypothetical protein
VAAAWSLDAAMEVSKIMMNATERFESTIFLTILLVWKRELSFGSIISLFSEEPFMAFQSYGYFA